MTPLTGRKELEDHLSDYRSYGEFLSAEEVGQLIIDLREKKPKNVTDEAKAHAQKLNIGGIQDHFDRSWFSDPTIGVTDAGEGSLDLMPNNQQRETLGEYRWLFKDVYHEVGDFRLAQNRALDTMGRIYGVNTISGKGRIVKYPPQKVCPAINGSHDWMRERLETEVNNYVPLHIIVKRHLVFSFCVRTSPLQTRRVAADLSGLADHSSPFKTGFERTPSGCSSQKPAPGEGW